MVRCSSGVVVCRLLSVAIDRCLLLVVVCCMVFVVAVTVVGCRGVYWLLQLSAC